MVDFRYEQLQTFCFYCGIIGHHEKVCTKNLNDSSNCGICEEKYGDWMRAANLKGVKKRVKEGMERELNLVMSHREKNSETKSNESENETK